MSYDPEYQGGRPAQIRRSITLGSAEGVDGPNRASALSGRSRGAFRSTFFDHGLRQISEEVDALDLQSATLNDGAYDTGHSSRTSILRPSVPPHQSTSSHPDPRPPMRSFTATHYSAPSYTLSAPRPFPEAITYPQPMPNGMANTDSTPSFASPVSSRSFSSPWPANVNWRPGRDARQTNVSNHPTDHVPTAGPSDTSYSAPGASGPRRQTTKIRFGAPIERVQAAFDRSFSGIDQSSSNSHPEYPRYPMIDPYAPERQMQQGTYGAQIPTRKATADQVYQYEPGTYAMQSAYNQEMEPLQSSPELPRFPQDIEPVSDRAGRYASDQTQDSDWTPGMLHESPPSVRHQLEVVDSIEPDIHEEATNLKRRELTSHIAPHQPVHSIAVDPDRGDALDGLDDLYDIPDEFGNTSDAEKALYKLMAKLSNLNLSDKLSLSRTSVAGGGQADIYKSKFMDGREVAVKIFRFDMRDNMRLTKRITRELRICSKVDHKNVLPFLGFVEERSRFRPGLVTPWVDAGNLRKYMSNNINIDVHSITLGIARGLDYLHSKQIVHGDLKPENILIAAGPTPVLMDFGLSHLQSSTSTFESATDGSNGTIDYMAVELLAAEDDAKLEHTTHSDVWAFGMISQEILTRRRPYPRLTKFAVIRKICDGVVPQPPPEHCSWDSRNQMLWWMCVDCWAKEPRSRPDMPSLLLRILELSNERPCSTT